MNTIPEIEGYDLPSHVSLHFRRPRRAGGETLVLTDEIPVEAAIFIAQSVSRDWEIVESPEDEAGLHIYAERVVDLAGAEDYTYDADEQAFFRHPRRGCVPLVLTHRQIYRIAAAFCLSVDCAEDTGSFFLYQPTSIEG